MYCRLYLPDGGNVETLTQFIGLQSDNSGDNKAQKITTMALPTYVAKTLDPVRCSRGTSDSRFPDGVIEEVRTDNLTENAIRFIYS